MIRQHLISSFGNSPLPRSVRPAPIDTGDRRGELDALRAYIGLPTKEEPFVPQPPAPAAPPAETSVEKAFYSGDKVELLPADDGYVKLMHDNGIIIENVKGEVGIVKRVICNMLVVVFSDGHHQPWPVRFAKLVDGGPERCGYKRVANRVWRHDETRVIVARGPNGGRTGQWTAQYDPPPDETAMGLNKRGLGYSGVYHFWKYGDPKSIECDSFTVLSSYINRANNWLNSK